MHTNNPSPSIAWNRQYALPTPEQYYTIHQILEDLNSRRAAREDVAKALEIYAVDNTVFDICLMKNQVKDDILGIDDRLPITFDIAWNSLAQVLVPIGYFPPKKR